MEHDISFLDIMYNFLIEKEKLTPLAQGARDRQDGKTLSLSEHLKYLIHAQLSSGER